MSLKVRFFDPGKSFLQHRGEMLYEINRILIAGDLILRDDVTKFEQNLAQFCGKKYAIGLNSGTDALYLALVALGIKSGDEVIVSSHTFVASVQVIVQLGAVPVLVDLGDDWQKHITPKTKAVIPCHIAGEVLDWEPVEGIHMIDDSCQALGASGLKGIIQCWSFYPAKILGAFGDAGGITTDDEKLARDIKDLGNHWKSDYSRWGINSRMDNIQATVLNVKIKYLSQTLARREEIAMKYHNNLHPTLLPRRTTGRVWQDFIIQTDRRDELFDYLKSKGIETMKNEYSFPIPKLPKSLKYESQTLRLPINEVLTNEEIQYVIDTINTFYE